jgi:hypothetical protein
VKPLKRNHSELNDVPGVGRVNMYIPRVLSDYRTNLIGVDKFNQKFCYYTITRRPYKSWHMIFFTCVDMAIVNSYILYTLDCKNLGLTPMDQYSFRSSIVRDLVPSNWKGPKGRHAWYLKRARILRSTYEHHSSASHTRALCMVCGKNRSQNLCSSTLCSGLLFCAPCYLSYHSKAVSELFDFEIFNSYANTPFSTTTQIR